MIFIDIHGEQDKLVHYFNYKTQAAAHNAEAYSLTLLLYCISQEYDNICSWSVRNKLTINTGKTKEIVFHRPTSRDLNIPPPLPDIERVSQATLLRIDITPTLVTSGYVNKMLTQINQRLYLLSQLKLQGLNIQALHTLFTGVIMSKIMYALLAFAGQLTADDKTQDGRHITKSFTTRCITLTLTKSSIAQTANCFPRLLNLDIVYTISSLPRLPHTALTVFGKDSIIISVPSCGIFTV